PDPRKSCPAAWPGYTAHPPSEGTNWPPHGTSDSFSPGNSREKESCGAFPEAAPPHPPPAFETAPFCRYPDPAGNLPESPGLPAEAAKKNLPYSILPGFFPLYHTARGLSTFPLTP